MDAGWMREWIGLVLAALLGLGGAPTPALAQDSVQDGVEQQAGVITGVVVDEQNGEPLPGANVSIKGTTKGTTTDLKGRYRLANLDPGQYDVLFSFVGFQEKTVTGVEVTPGQTTKIEVTLSVQTETLDEVVISAEAARDSEAGMLKQRAEAAAVSNAISAEAIGRAGAGTAADAMSKVTGASVVEGKYVNVRGLQGRYVDVQLNGSTMPSADPDGNSVALDVFPSNLIDNIVTTKTFTPDKPGTFTGGAIDIRTKSFPDDFFLNASLSTSINSEVGIGGSVLRPTDGLSAVPEAADDPDVPENIAQTFNDPGKQQALHSLSRAFATQVTPRRDEIVGNRSAEASFGNQFQVLGERPLGVIASLSYDESFSGYDDGKTARFQQAGMESETLGAEADYTTQRGVENVLWGGLIGMNFRPAPQHELGLRFLYNEDEEKEARVETGVLPRDLSSGQRFQTRVSRTTERSVRSGEVTGTHRFGSGRDGIQVEWKGSLSAVTRDEPDYRFFSNQFTPRDGDTTYSISKSIYPVPARYFRDLEEEDASANASIDIPLGVATLTAGGRYRSRTRTFRERRFDHVTDKANFAGDPDAYVNEQAGLIDDSGNFGTYVLDRTQDRNNYDADQQTGAGFLMVETPVPGVPSLEMIGGVRVEHSDMSLASFADRLQGDFSNTDVLPSANLIWSLRDDMNVRLAYGRTIALPSFREFAPFESFSFVGDFIERGNEDLNRTRVDNLDLRWEWFVGPGELLSASVYYKDFTDPIERTIDPKAAANQVVTYRNRDRATVYGLELEARKNLGGLASWLRHVQVGGNLTLAQSEVTRTEEVLEAIRAFDENPSETRPLQGQSPYLLNLNAGYENPEAGTSVNVFFNRFGDRLQTVSRNGVDIFERARSTLDVTASQRLLRGVSIKASVKNILDSEEIVSQQFKGTEYVNDQRPLGRTVSVGVSYSF
jgi:outer membrane receptor protein involved in Fe transport